MQIELRTAAEATLVFDAMHSIMNQFKNVCVSDLHDLVGLRSDYTDSRQGWSSLSEMKIVKKEESYLIDLPNPEPIKVES